MTSNQNTKEADAVVDNNVEEGISNEADAPANADDAPAETTDNKTDQTSAAEDESVSPTIPWWKQKRLLEKIGMIVLFIILVVAIVLGVTLSSSNNKCFGADEVVYMVFFTMQFVRMLIKIVLIIKIVLLLKRMAGR